jgi:hypothetical protein
METPLGQQLALAFNQTEQLRQNLEKQGIVQLADGTFVKPEVIGEVGQMTPVNVSQFPRATWETPSEGSLQNMDIPVQALASRVAFAHSRA